MGVFEQQGLRAGNDVVPWESMTDEQLIMIVKTSELDQTLQYPDDRPLTELEALEDIRAYRDEGAVFKSEVAAWLFRKIFRKPLPGDLKEIKPRPPVSFETVPDFPLEEAPF